MDVITTHINADFDALASMVAAKKLYPQARMVFPGSQEKSVRDFFLKSTLISFPFDRLKDIDLAAVTRLVMVDIKMKGRLGAFDEVAERKGVELDIYDHHPRTERDYKGSVEVVDEVGANATLMTEILREKGIPLTPEEATVLALGIYEDTGSLTFPSTTVRDLAAVAYLLEHGAVLSIIPAFISRDLSAEQVAVLDTLIKSLKVHDVQGVPVAVAVAVSDEYVADLALIVHKLVDMKNLEAFFALVRMGDRVYLIARSRLPEVSAARAAEEFGGGGHPTAASATIRDLTLEQVEERLLSHLLRVLGERKTAGTLMNAPVISLSAGETIARAQEVMNRFNINSLPVTDGEGRMRGLITRGAVDRAVRHSLGGNPASEYMLTDFLSVREDSPLSLVEEYIVERRQRTLPVLSSEGKVLGIISRTDLLESMHEDLARARGTEEEKRKAEKPERVKNLREVMREILPSDTLQILRRAGETAERMGTRAYVVGGFVRDLILRNPNLDLDLVVEGDGIEYGRRLARSLKARIRTHRKFMTAKLILPGGSSLDVATARAEYYEAPGALPTVEEGSIKLDLYRRDFSINALAIRLNPDRFGQVVDFFGGQRDLKEHTVRVLHNLSFVEDPTRVIRAVRFEQRFCFRIGKHTQSLLRNAVSRGYLGKTQGFRVFNELLAVLREGSPGQGFARMEQLGILRGIHPALFYGKREGEVFAKVEKVLSWYALLYLPEPADASRVHFNTFMLTRTPEEREGILRALSLPRQQERHLLSRWASLAAAAGELEPKKGARIPPSRLARLLSRFPPEEVLALMALARRTETSRSLSGYLSRLRQMRREVDGKTLVEMGYRPGPLFGRILAAVQDARVDGLLKTRAEEVRFIRKHFPLPDSS